MADIVELSNDLELVNSYQKLARDYGLFAKKVYMAQPGSEAKEYLVFSISPIKDDVNPVAIINRNNRNNKIFYPENFAIEMHAGNPLLAWEKISRYVAYAELICDAYNQFGTSLPKAIRMDELLELANFYCKANSTSFDEETRKDYWKGLRDFFKDENPKSKFKKEWLAFYRSELYDADKSFLQNLGAFMKRHEPETSLDNLIESSGDLKKVYMPEHHYKKFREIIKERYPGVKYSVSEKRVVDKGLIVDPDTNRAVDTPYGKTITEEEYDKIIEERFAIEGFACLDGLTPSYFEGRDIMYKASDENIVAAVSHEVAYRWAKCPSLETIKQRGALSSVDIPVGHLRSFYCEMMDADIPIYIDSDVNSQPNFETVRIIYSERDDRVVHNILVGLAMAQVNLAHYSLTDKDILFDIDVTKVDALIRQAKARAIAGPNDKGFITDGKAEVNGDLLIE